MLRLIYGGKGSGKTKRIIKCANDEITSARGEHIYITDTLMHTIDIDRRVRFVNIAEYSIDGEKWFVGFLKGMIAGNSDVTRVYIDGINRFLTPPNEMQWLLGELEKISQAYKINFAITVSTDNLPDFMKRYI